MVLHQVKVIGWLIACLVHEKECEIVEVHGEAEVQVYIIVHE